MSTRLTIFTATLVQDSALSVSGIDRETSSDQPLAMVDGKPMLVGRGLKGACVAMAKRFFDPLPRAVSDDINNGALRRSAWEFEDATTVGTPQLRAGVGIRHKTGARAEGVLYDREVIPARTRWDLRFRVDWSFALNEDEAKEAEGILGYVLQEHWAQGRCWLGGGAARGLGWCTIKDLKAWQLDDDSYVKWVNTGRPVPPELTAMSKVPIVQPTRAWSFRTLDLQVTCGEYKPNPDEAAWGLDMLAVGPHEGESSIQTTGDGTWATPAWVENTNVPKELVTDRSILMDGSRPLLPGSSVRGPLRHAFSRSRRVDGKDVADPHLDPEKVAPEDEGGKLFGTVDRSSRVLICDARAEAEWAAAKMHMHAEDEFSAGSYGSAKRDAVRMLRGEFRVRIVVEDEDPKTTEDMVDQLAQEIALGELGHLPIGGHKTRGAGGGRWKAGTWTHDHVQKERDWKQPESEQKAGSGSDTDASANKGAAKLGFITRPDDIESSWVRVKHGSLSEKTLTLDAAIRCAKEALGERALVAWWCDPTIDLDLHTPPATFGFGRPESEEFQVDDVAFYSESAVWKAARTCTGIRWVFIEETHAQDTESKKVQVLHTPARLHASNRFAATKTGMGKVLLREWYDGDESLGFTISQCEKENV